MDNSPDDWLDQEHKQNLKKMQQCKVKEIEQSQFSLEDFIVWFVYFIFN